MGNSDHDTTYMRLGGDDGELRPWHYIYVYSITLSLSHTQGPPALGVDGTPSTRRTRHEEVVSRPPHLARQLSHDKARPPHSETRPLRVARRCQATVDHEPYTLTPQH